VRKLVAAYRFLDTRRRTRKFSGRPQFARLAASACRDAEIVALTKNSPHSA